MTDIAKSTPSTIEIVQRDNAYQGFYKLDRVQLRHEKFDGGMSRVINREVFVRHDAVCVLPYDPQRDEVVLIEQFRVGAMGRAANPWLVEMVAGLIDKDEQPEEVAHREAEEEAGLTFSALWPITQYFPSPGGSTEFSTCTWAVATVRAPVASMDWKKRQKISASAPGLSKMPCKRCVMVGYPMRPALLPCNG
jgi:ADP-ribose pyrophosphatase